MVSPGTAAVSQKRVWSTITGFNYLGAIKEKDGYRTRPYAFTSLHCNPNAYPLRFRSLPEPVLVSPGSILPESSLPELRMRVASGPVPFIGSVFEPKGIVGSA